MNQQAYVQDKAVVEYQEMKHRIKQSNKIAAWSFAAFLAGHFIFGVYNDRRIKNPEDYVEQTPIIHTYLEAKTNLEILSQDYNLILLSSVKRQISRENNSGANELNQGVGLSRIITNKEDLQQLESLERHVLDIVEKTEDIFVANQEEINKYFRDISNVRKNAERAREIDNKMGYAVALTLAGYVGLNKLRLRNKRKQLPKQIK